MRRFVVGAVIALLTLVVAWLQPLHAAVVPSVDVGQSVSVLTHGLVSQNGRTVKFPCGPDASQIIYGIETGWYDPKVAEQDRDPDSNMLVNTLQVSGKDRVAITFAADDPGWNGTAVMLYAVDKYGIIRYAVALGDSGLTAEQTGKVCAVLQDLLRK